MTNPFHVLDLRGTKLERTLLRIGKVCLAVRTCLALRALTGSARNSVCEA